MYNDVSGERALKPDPDRQPAPQYDAFISYHSADRLAVRRIQRFLESYRMRLPSGERRHVRVYLDATDIRGGSLETELGTALGASRVLLLGCSEASKASDWMRFEIRQFVQGREQPLIAPILLSDDPEKTLLAELKTLPELQSNELRWHDVRNGWRLGLLTPKAKDELLRLLALIADVELRTLRNWRLRRTVTIAALWVVGLLGIPAVYLSLPVDHWEPMQLKESTGAPLDVVACGFKNGELWAASRLRQLAGDRPRNYIRFTEGVLTPHPKDSYEPRQVVHERLLPQRMIPFDMLQRVRNAFGLELWARLDDTTNDPMPPLTWIGEPVSDRFIVVRKLPPTPEQVESAKEFWETSLLKRTPLTSALVAVYDGGSVHTAQVEELAPEWHAKQSVTNDPPTPAEGLAVAWDDTGHQWLGMSGRTDQERGGLWRSEAGGQNWMRVDDFSSVHSIAVLPGPYGLVFISELAFDKWIGAGELYHYPTRVLQGDHNGRRWSPAPSPALTAADVEICGADRAGRLFVRVANAIFGYQRVARFKVQWLKRH